jgi:hypothetical protein
MHKAGSEDVCRLRKKRPKMLWSGTAEANKKFWCVAKTRFFFLSV